jgi:hypothetical protein
MAALAELLAKIIDDALRSAMGLRRNGNLNAGNLRDLHAKTSPRLYMTELSGRRPLKVPGRNACVESNVGTSSSDIGVAPAELRRSESVCRNEDQGRRQSCEQNQDRLSATGFQVVATSTSEESAELGPKPPVNYPDVISKLISSRKTAGRRYHSWDMRPLKSAPKRHA